MKAQCTVGIAVFAGLFLVGTAQAQQENVPGCGPGGGWRNGQGNGPCVNGSGSGMPGGQRRGWGAQRGGRGMGMGQGMGRGMGQGMGQGMMRGMGQGNCLQQGQGGAVTKPLSESAKQAVLGALSGPDGEYQAHAFYGAILAKHGQVQPYAAIQQAEERHIAALSRQLEKYGVAVPADKWAGNITAPASLEKAAKDAVQAEEKNVAIYDKLLAQVKDYPDLTRVFQNLRSASQDAHLPAFHAAVANNGQLTAAQMQSSLQGKNGRGRGACCGRCLTTPSP